MKKNESTYTRKCKWVFNLFYIYLENVEKTIKNGFIRLDLGRIIFWNYIKNGRSFNAISRLWRTRCFPYRKPRDYLLEGVLQTPHQLRHGVY